MRLKETVARKHVHSWKLVQDENDYSYGGTRRVTRDCADCGVRQRASWCVDDDVNRTPDSLVHLADTEWTAVDGT